MQFITNATFLINIIKIDMNIVKEVKALTINSVSEEVMNELFVDIKKEMNVKVIGKTKNKLEISSSKQKLLSKTDIELLNISYENKNNSILITDDKCLRGIAKENGIKTFTTPQFILYLFKEKYIDKKYSIKFLNDLKVFYIRAKDIEKVIEKIGGLNE